MTLPTVEKNTVLVIRTDGTEEIVKGKPKILAMRSMIRAESLDFVRIGKLIPNDLTMAVDDLGWETETIDHGDGRIELKPVRARKPINAKATALLPRDLSSRHDAPDRRRRRDLSRRGHPVTVSAKKVDFRRRGGLHAALSFFRGSPMRSTAQWRAAWALLPEEWRRAIAEFCLRSDRDIAAAVLKPIISP
jgi:hypothetical protein